MTMARTSGPTIPAHPLPDWSDAHLLKQFVQRRDETAFAALMERHGPMVLGVCRRVLHDRQDVDDAFQATFLVLLRKAASLRRPESLANWLYGVAYRVALQARAVAVRWRAVERQVENVPAAEPVDAKVWDELRPVLDEEINRLPEKYRAPVVLCYLEGKTYTEAARLLGWADGTVSGRLARAREKLRVRFALRGLTLSAAVLVTALGQQGAAVPPALAQATLQGVLLTASGQATAGLISVKAVTFSKAALKAAFLAKLKAVAVGLAVVGVVMTGVWTLTPAGRAVSAHLGINGEQASEDDRDRLQGTWACVAVQDGGRTSGAGDLTWTFNGDTVVIRSGGQEQRGTYRVRRMLVVHRFIDVTIPDPGGASVTLYGSFAFEKDGLSVCLNKNPDLRPKTVVPNAANGDVRYDFQQR